MGKLLIVQTRISREKIEQLKIKTGKETIKDALSEAVYHYLYCPLIDEIDVEVKKDCRSNRGRKPLYLKQLTERYVSDQR
jgi:hypothetical protein